MSQRSMIDYDAYRRRAATLRTASRLRMMRAAGRWMARSLTGWMAPESPAQAMRHLQA